MEHSGRERAAHYVSSGADLVLSLPVAAALGGFGKKEFANAALVQRLRSSERLVIPCVPVHGQTPEDCKKQLRSCAMLMFREEGDYRRKLTGKLNEGMAFRDAQFKTVCDCFPQAQELLSFQENRNALWLLDSMLQLYYMPKTEFISVSDTGSDTPDRMENDRLDRIIASKTAQLLSECSEEDLIDISGSTTQIVADLFEKKESIQASASVQQIIQLLAPASPDRVRLFLLKAVLRIRKIYMQICGLHEYVPYCHAAAADPAKAGLIEQLSEGSWVPFVGEDGAPQKVADDYYYLLEADKKAEDLTKD